MDQNTLTQERIARKQIEAERRARPVENLSKSQKKLLRDIRKGKYPESGPGIKQNSDLEAVALTLQDLGLIKVYIRNCEVFPYLTNKGKVLLLDHPHLRRKIDLKWVITTAISIAAILIAYLKN